MQPASAEAATVAGLARCVRTPGPWRPSKLRLVLLITRRALPKLSPPTKKQRAAALAPLEAGVDEHPVQAFGLGRGAHRHRAGHHQRLDARCDMAPAQQRRGLAQIGQSRVGTRADEGRFDRRAQQHRARAQVHVVQCALRRDAPRRVAVLRRVGHAPVDGPAVLGACAPAELRCERGHVDRAPLVPCRILVRPQRAPMRRRLLEQLARRGEGSARHPLQRALVRRHQAGPGAELHRHVAQRHAPFDVERAHGLAGKLDGATLAARRAEARDQRQRHVLGAGARRQPPVEAHLHAARPRTHQRLRGHRMFAFGGTDAPGQRAQAADGAGVAVGTDQRDAWQRNALLGRDHVHDALARVVKVDQSQPGSARAQAEFADEGLAAGEERAFAALGKGVDDVVHRAEHQLRMGHPPSRRGQPGQQRRAGALVQEDAVDEKQRALVVKFGHDMRIPDAVDHGLRCVDARGLGTGCSGTHARHSACRPMATTVHRPLHSAAGPRAGCRCPTTRRPRCSPAARLRPAAHGTGPGPGAIESAVSSPSVPRAAMAGSG
jgi:hypothetical protein